MPQILSAEGFKEKVDRIVEELAEEEGVTEEMVAFIIPDVTGCQLYTASKNNPNDRLHPKLAYGQNGEGLKTQDLDRGLQGIAMGGYRGALLGTGVVTIEELGPEATGVALENLGRVPEPYEGPEEEPAGHQTAHIKSRDKSSDVEGETEVTQ